MKSITLSVLFVVICYSYGKSITPRRPHSKHNKYNPNTDQRIVGGQNTVIEQHPYMAYIILDRNGDYYQCSGSIISKIHILTAAHCVNGTSGIAVRVGNTDKAKGPVTLAANYIVHPRYNAKRQNYDAAVVTLKDNINIDGKKTKVIQLEKAKTRLNAGTILTVAGWGMLDHGELSKTLMAIEVPVQSESICSKAYKMTQQKFCAGESLGGKDACQGDSGGPAVVSSSRVQVGIVSYGIGCGERGYPGVYTNVSAIRAWIKAVSGV